MKRHILVLLATLAVTASVQAQTPPAGGAAPPADRAAARAAIAKACSTDMKSYCSDKQPGREMMMCLRENGDKLSADCKDTLASMRRNAPPPQGQ